MDLYQTRETFPKKKKILARTTTKVQCHKLSGAKVDNYYKA
jgi:hypothetical protein